MLFKEIGISAITMIAMDSVYLKNVQKAYSKQMQKIQGSPINLKMIPAIICYILLVFGLNYFIISKKLSVLDAFIFGVVMYGVYDATTYAVIDDWSPYLAVIDTIWGGILMSATTYITYSLL